MLIAKFAYISVVSTIPTYRNNFSHTHGNDRNEYIDFEHTYDIGLSQLICLVPINMEITAI